MKKVIITAFVALAVNLLAGLMLSAYAPINMLFTSMAIIINTLLVCLLFVQGAESTHRLSLGMLFLGFAVLEFVCGCFAPERWADNWWLMGTAVFTAIEVILTYLAIHYSKK